MLLTGIEQVGHVPGGYKAAVFLQLYHMEPGSLVHYVGSLSRAKHCPRSTSADELHMLHCALSTLPSPPLIFCLFQTPGNSSSAQHLHIWAQFLVYLFQTQGSLDTMRDLLRSWHRWRGVHLTWMCLLSSMLVRPTQLWLAGPPAAFITP